MPLYTGDYKRDTDHLEAEEHGAYLLLLMALWDRGGKLRNDPALLARTARVSLRKWPKIWRTLEPFFVIQSGEIHQTRVNRELARTAVISQLRREAAMKRESKKGKKNSKPPQAIAEQKHHIQTRGLDSPSKEGENPDLPKPDSSSHAASPPSPMEGGGDATDGEHIRTLNRWLQGKVHGLMVSNVLTGRDVRELKEAVRGGSEDCLLLAPGYSPPEHVAAALKSIAVDFAFLPKLRLVNES
jgi:uncharacterized protein YdaU (DUF1376 family)